MTQTQTPPTYAPGTPLWVDHGSPDVGGAARFYSQLFGWQAEDLGEQTGHYHMLRQDGKAVAATSPLMNERNSTMGINAFGIGPIPICYPQILEREPQMKLGSFTLIFFSDIPHASIICYSRGKIYPIPLSNRVH